MGILRKEVKVSCNYISLYCLLYVLMPAFILSVFLLAKIGSPVLAYLSSCAFLAMSACFFCSNGKMSIVDCVIIILVIVFSHIVSYVFFDLFHDGLAYHQPAISRIAAGFNPIYDGYMNLGRPTDIWSTQATYFPKALWYFAACVTAIFGDIQLGKAYHLILFFAAVFYVLQYASDKKKRLLWVLCCCSPIFLYQYMTYLTDAALGSLIVIGLFYAQEYFMGKEKNLDKAAHIIALLSLSLLFCIKSTGIAYGSIIIFCIALHEVFVACISGKDKEKRFYKSLSKGFKLGLKLTIPVLCIVLVLGYSPYVTNLLEKHDIFYPLFTNIPGQHSVQTINEGVAKVIYPNVNNRMTRVVFSIFAYPLFGHDDAAELKNPLSAPSIEWKMYAMLGNTRAGGLGPLYALLLIISVLLQIVCKGRGNGWLLCTLLLMTLIQPYAYEVRFAPFLWCYPFVCLMSLPDRRAFLLTVPVMLAIVNIAGLGVVILNDRCELMQLIKNQLGPYKGQTVLLDRSIFQVSGMFDRFDIKQKFINPEVKIFNTSPNGWTENSVMRDTGRMAFGSNIAFKEDLPPLIMKPIVLKEDAEVKNPWLRMSEGAVFVDFSNGVDRVAKIARLSDHSLSTGCWNIKPKVKFFMRMMKEPLKDVELILTGGPYKDKKEKFQSQRLDVYINYSKIGSLIYEKGGIVKKSLFVSKDLLMNSYHDDTGLLTLMFEIYGVNDSGDVVNLPSFNFNFKFDQIWFREKEDPRSN